MSEPVIVTSAGSSPTLALDVGGQARTASYVSGSGTSTLVFSYPVQSGDFDPDGIGVVRLDSDGTTSSIKDAAGNLADTRFQAATLADAKVQTYSVAWQTQSVTPSNAASASFTISGAPANVSYTYTVTSDADATVSLTGGGTTSSGTTAKSIDVSGLRPGNLSLQVALSLNGVSGITKTTAASISASGITSGPFDSLSLAAAGAWSVRQLRAAYTGPLMQVRRSSDSAVAGIYPTIAGNLDTAKLASFCGAGTCYVSIWYDQSGNGRHAVQATAAYQPRIFSGGKTDTAGSMPAGIYWDGSGVFLDAPMAAIGGKNLLANHVAAVTPAATPNSFGRVMSCGVSGQQSWLTAGHFTTTIRSNLSTFGVENSDAGYAVATSANSGFTPGAPFVYSFDASGTAHRGILNGVQTAAWTPLNNPDTWTFTNIRFGLDNYSNITTTGGVADTKLKGYISEAIVFGSQLATRADLERNQGSYYGITVQ